ncbi:MAG: pyridoxal-phosphate dependent enzyme [Gammaproteobacteria bacterium]|nr:pyridoxal-phosphate dependent enzyme [Gammaproteobacteria bacterium]NCF80334.1 pyridoxal-phosphate dependent enzyme [Pseudomonadota bacterium]
MRCSAIDEIVGASVHFKCENLQKVGAFKFRGACNTVLSLSEKEIENGIATHSSGNHGAAVALAARLRGTTAVVVMPSNTSAVKQAAVAHYGARIVHCEPNDESRRRTLEAIIAEEGRTLVHPFDDVRVIAGQGTAALEFLEQVPDLDIIMTPVGGGGLLSGTATVVAALSPKTRVIGAEPAGADDTYQSFRAGHIIPVGVPDTIADGLRTTVGELTFPIIARHVSDIVRVSEEAIVEAMRLTWQRTKLIVEASAAVPLAALLEGTVDVRDARVGIIISGGNVDLDALPW